MAFNPIVLTEVSVVSYPRFFLTRYKLDSERKKKGGVIQ